MNGWQRLFTLGVLATGVACVAIAASFKPDRTAYVVCGLANNYVSPERAMEWAKVGDIPAAEWASYQTTSPLDDPECRKEIVAIGNGDRYRADTEEFWRSLGSGALAFACYWGVIYALGWGLGWVWRGFFPRKSPA